MNGLIARVAVAVMAAVTIATFAPRTSMAVPTVDPPEVVLPDPAEGLLGTGLFVAAPAEEGDRPSAEPSPASSIEEDATAPKGRPFTKSAPVLTGPRDRSSLPDRAADGAAVEAGSRTPRRAARASSEATRSVSPTAPGTKTRSIPDRSTVVESADSTELLPKVLRSVVNSLPESVKVVLGFMAAGLALLLFGVLWSRRQLADALRRAHEDALTALPNRAAADEALRRMAGQAARNGTSMATVLFDIDHFKSVNDVYGHSKGDEVLAAIGAAARAELRAADFVARYGGEEFLLLMPDTGEAGAKKVAEKLQLAFRQIEIQGLDRTITASFGVAAGHGNKEELPELVQAADETLYRAKENGRDRIECASETHIAVGVA